MKTKILYLLTVIVVAYFITFLSVGVPSWVHRLMLGISFSFMIWSYLDLQKGKVVEKRNGECEDFVPRSIEDLEEICKRKK